MKIRRLYSKPDSAFISKAQICLGILMVLFVLGSGLMPGSVSAWAPDTIYNPAGTTINMFDYYMYNIVNLNNRNFENSTNFDLPNENNLANGQYRVYTGINQRSADSPYYHKKLFFFQNHYLQDYVDFFTGEYEPWNIFTGEEGGPVTGIVENTLNANGFPVIPDIPEDPYDEPEPLDYLFNTSPIRVRQPENWWDPVSGPEGGPIKDVYPNVDKLFTVDSEGFYYFNSDEDDAKLPREAVYDCRHGTTGLCESGLNFTVRDAQWPDDDPEGSVAATHPKFNPFGDPEFYNHNGQMEVVHPENYFYGMHMQVADFSIPANGKVLSPYGTYNDMLFDFSGDDDVWIFLNGVLIGDLGGIHVAQEISINFSTDEVKTWNHNVGSAETAEPRTLRDIIVGAVGADEANKRFLWDDSGRLVTSKYDKNTGETEYKYLTLDFFYLERGASYSNLEIRYNLVSSFDFTAHKSLSRIIPEGYAEPYRLNRNDFQFKLTALLDKNPDTPMPQDGDNVPPKQSQSICKQGQDGENPTLTCGTTRMGYAYFGDITDTLLTELYSEDPDQAPVFYYKIEEVIPDPEECKDNGDGTCVSSALGFPVVYTKKPIYFTGTVDRTYIEEPDPQNDHYDYYIHKTYYTDETFTEEDKTISFINFENTMAMIQPEGVKTIAPDRDLKAGDYEFEIVESVEGKETRKWTVSHDDLGTIDYPVISYTLDQNHWNEDHTSYSKTYAYTVSEKAAEGSLPADPAVYQFTAVVEAEEDGHITIDLGSGDDISDLDFDNVFTAEITFSGTKKLTGTRTQPNANEFIFRLEETTEGAEKPYTALALNAADGTYSFDPISFTEAGTYTYKVTEVKGDDPEVLYDDTEYEITVTVEYKDGELSAEAAVDPEADVSKLDFENIIIEPAELTFSGTKTLTGTRTQPKANEFIFRLEETTEGAEKPYTALALNAADGTYAFDPVSFTKAGTYTYEVTEVEGADPDVTYDDKKYEITVTVAEAGGVLTPTVSVSPAAEITALNFENSIDEDDSCEEGPAAEVLITGTKSLTGRQMMENEFVFVLTEISAGGYTDKALNDGTGAFAFHPVRYTEPGTYSYRVTESAGYDPDVTYDNTVYEVTVTVDVTAGGLAATVRYFREGVEVDAIEFENEIAGPSSAEIRFSGIKNLSGKTLHAGEFIFELAETTEGAASPVIRTASNDENGSFTFGYVTYDEPGTYTYTVREIAGTDPSITYDTTVYQIAVTVSDDFTVSADMNTEALVFRNSYEKKEEPSRKFFRLHDHLPETGFSALRNTVLPEQPLSIRYKPVNWSIEIPSLGLSADIVEVPFTGDQYPVTWLGSSVGLPEGSPLPGEGRAVLVGHNHLNTTEAGPFALLSSLSVGDRFFVRGDKNEFVPFVIRVTTKIAEANFDAFRKISDMDERSLLLVTCEDERAEGGYANRRIVAAVPAM